MGVVRKDGVLDPNTGNIWDCFIAWLIHDHWLEIVDPLGHLLKKLSNVVEQMHLSLDA